MTEDFQCLIREAIASLDKIAAHDDFLTLLEQGCWDYPETTLIQCRECLEDLHDAHDKCLKNNEDGE